MTSLLAIKDEVSQEIKGASQQFFIGLSAIENTQIFMWDDESKLTWSNWGSNQPDFLPKKEDKWCGVVVPSDDWKMADVACNSKQGFICCYEGKPV